MIKINLHVTNDCNLRCTHCFLNSGRDKMGQLSLSQYEELLNSLKRIDINHIHITGGEPLVYSHIFELLNLCKKYRIKTELQTNGCLINQEVIDKLVSNEVHRVYISLDGNKEKHEYRRGKNTYEKAVSAIKMLIKNNIKVSVNFCASKENIVDTIKTIELCAKLGVNQFTIIRYNIESRDYIDSSTTPLDPIEWLNYIAAIKNELNNRTDIQMKISYNKAYFDLDVEKVKIRDFNIAGLIFILSNGCVYPCGPSIGYSAPVANFPEDNIEEIVQKVSDWKCPKREVCRKCEELGRCPGVCAYQPIDESYFCSNTYKKYKGKRWYPGCPLRGSTVQKDIIYGEFPNKCSVSQDYEEYYRKLYNK